MGSIPYWGPDEPVNVILLERSFLAGDFLTGVGYGMQFILYISCALFLWNTRKFRGKQSVYLLIYITLLFCSGTIFAAVQARAAQVMYIDNRNYPGGPWQYFLVPQHLIIILFYGTLLVPTILSDLLVLWRCWVIWGGSGTYISYGVVTLPFLMVLASFTIGTLWMLQNKQLELIRYGTSYFAISIGVNILLSILIAARLLTYRRKAISTLPPGHAAHYFSLAAIFVESATLYSLTALAFIVCYAVRSPLSPIFICTAVSIQQIAGYLIIYRIAKGRAWNQGTITNKLQTLRCHQPTSGGTATTASTNLETPIDSVPFALPYAQDQSTHLTAEKKGEEEVSIYIA